MKKIKISIDIEFNCLNDNDYVKLVKPVLK